MQSGTLYSVIAIRTKVGRCCRLAEILENVSHESVNRLLLTERYEPKDLFDTVKQDINRPVRKINLVLKKF